MCFEKLSTLYSYVVDEIKLKYSKILNYVRSLFDAAQRKMDPFGLYLQSTFFVKNREVQYEHFFTVLSHMMRYCGYDPRYLSDCVNKSQRRILILKNIFYWMLAISAAAMLFLIFCEAWKSHDMGKLALATSTSLTAVVYFLVVGRLQLSKVEIFNFFERFRQNFPTQGHVAVNACLFIQKLSVVFIMLWLVLIIIVCFVPLASILLFGRKILFYPVPEFMMHGLIYFSTYLWSDHIVIFTNLQYLTLTLIIVTLVSLVCLEFDQLAHDVASLKHLDENELSESLPTLVERHIRALELTETLDGFFSIIFLIRFVLSIFAIGIDFFAIMSLKNPSDISLGVALIISELSQLFMISCIGQMLINANNRFATAVYDCGWENWTSLSLKKNMLMILKKAQNPASLTIWKFGSISLELFASIVNSIYDITSFLSAVYDN